MWQSGNVAFPRKRNPQPLVGEIADVGRLTSYYSECYRAVAHTRGGADGREECCERGYYHLHRQLNYFLLLHDSMCFSVVRGSGGQPLLRLEARDYFCVGLSVLRLFSYHRTLAPPHPRNLPVAAVAVCLGCEDVAQRGLLLESLLLAPHRALLALHEIPELEDALLLEGAAGEFLALGVLGVEVDLDAVDHRLGACLHGLRDAVLALLLPVHTGAERAESVELHGLTLREQFGHTLDHLPEHQHAHLVVGDLAVRGHVLGEAFQVQRLLGVDLREVLAVGGRVVVLVLTEVDNHGDVGSCHNVNSFLFFN